MVALKNSGERAPSEGRRIVVTHHLPLRAEPNPNAPHGFDFSLDPESLPLQLHHGLPGTVVFVGTLPAWIPPSEELAADLLARFSCSPVFPNLSMPTFCLKYGYEYTWMWPRIHRALQQRSGLNLTEGEQYRAYLASKSIADRVLELLGKKKDLVVIHEDDDHRYLWALPTILRDKSPRARIAMFFGKDLLRALLHPEYAHAFFTSCSGVLSYHHHGGGNIGIDYPWDTEYLPKGLSMVSKRQTQQNRNYNNVTTDDVPYWGVISDRLLQKPQLIPAYLRRRPLTKWLHERLMHITSGDHGYFTRMLSVDLLLLAACHTPASRRNRRASITPNSSPHHQFLLDSGASGHFVGNAEFLRGVRPLTGNARRFATLPDGSRLAIISVGTIQMDGFSIPDVYLVEGLTVNLVSVGQLATNHGICCCFYRNRCQLITLVDGSKVGEAILQGNGVYELRFLRVPDAAAGSTDQ